MSELPETTRTMPRMTQYELYESLLETLRESIASKENTIAIYQNNLLQAQNTIKFLELHPVQSMSSAHLKGITIE